MLVPVVMGAVVEAVGLENGFYVMGGGAIALLAVVTVVTGRSQAFGR